MPSRSLPAWLCTVLLVTLCLLPRQLTPEGPSGSLSLRVPHLDKAAHATMFLAFGLLWARVALPSRQVRLVLLAGLLLAVGTELAQGLPPVDRDPDLLDALADVAGLLAGIASYRFAPRLSTA